MAIRRCEPPEITRLREDIRTIGELLLHHPHRSRTAAVLLTAWNDLHAILDELEPQP